MIDLRDALLNDIQAGLRVAWLNDKAAYIRTETSKITGLDGASGAQRSRLKKSLEAAGESEFNAFWEEVKHHFAEQYQSLYATVQNKLLLRHPWLREEKHSEQTSLTDLFLANSLKDLLFDLFVHKTKTAKTWSQVLIGPQISLDWKDIDHEAFDKRIAGYLLSDPNFYNDRPFPSYLDSPFTQVPTRYDLYRLLKKTYPDQFCPKTLANAVIGTTIAPLHYTELSLLTEPEWTNFETLIVNLGTERAPEWVVLDKKQGNWTVYAPPFLLDRCRENLVFPGVQFSSVKHARQPVYSELIDWHAVLLSRILPWCRSPNGQTIDLDIYRATLPVPLLLQNSIESSCLPAQKNAEQAAQTAFAKREPLSLASAKDLYASVVHLRPIETRYLFANIPETPANAVLQAFEQGSLLYEPEVHQLTISAPEQFMEAMKLVYYQRVKKMVILMPAPAAKLDRWFEYNLDLTSIETTHDLDYSYAHACTARNRFLAQTHYKSTVNNAIEAGEHAWKKTGAYIYQLFSTETELDPVQLQNIAEMGKEGLDVFFQHLNSVPQPNLVCTLDLDSGKTLTAQQYIEYLTDRIHAFKKPLFKQLDLILPKQLDEATQKAILDLLVVLNLRGELETVQLQNPQGINSAFLKQLKELAVNDKNIRLQITIPDWDEAVLTPTTKGGFKAAYREVQNAIVNNIQLSRKPVLLDNTESIRTPLAIRQLKRTQAMPDDESWQSGVSYSLGSGSVGVQQQAQQEIAQNVQQEAEQQSQPKSPSAREIVQYTGDESLLITRQTVRSHGASVEDFSAWVGSQIDAPFVIHRMDPAAYRKITAFPSLFKFGIDWKNTPGFRLYYAGNANKDLILTFDAALEAEDLDNQQLEPFAVEMKYSKPALAFHGDYRQLKRLGFSGEDSELTPWHHLATETLSHTVSAWLQSQNCSLDTSESMQYYNVNGVVKHSADQAAMIDLMKKWATDSLDHWYRAPDSDWDKTFLADMFDGLSLHNLRAFGQLFYRYDVSGTENWLHLMYKFHHVFSKQFPIFKQQILNSWFDWSENLEKPVVEALTGSMQKLEHHPVHQNIFWSLIAVHGETVVRAHDHQITPMQYAEVWRAYNRVIDYMDVNNLSINEAEFLQTIQAYSGQFNASQFLRRLYEVLQQTGSRQDSNHIQQNILNHLSEIDWYENGFYHACIHENYPYWDSALALSNLQRLDNQQPPSYSVKWDLEGLVIADGIGFTLRYVAQRLKWPKSEFDKFKKTLNTLPQQEAFDNLALFRLMTASIAVGMDTVDTLSNLPPEFWTTCQNRAYQAVLQTINYVILLDSKELSGGSYHLCIQDLPLLLEVLSETEIAVDLTTINALGRALRSFSGDKKGQLKQLVQYGLEHGFDQPLVTAYPWLVTDPIDNPPQHDESQRFYQQLSSIDFEHSKLPDKESLAAILVNMRSAEARHQSVRELIGLGCYITDQDAAFRPLKSDEKRMIDDLYLSKTFGAQNRLLLQKLFEHLALKEEGNVREKIQQLLNFFSNLDRKNYYDELGQLLGLLVEKAGHNQFYSLEQLTVWLSAAFEANVFKMQPYPVAYIDTLLTDALADPNTSLISPDLHQLAVKADQYGPLKIIIESMQLSPLKASAKQTLVKFSVTFKSETNLPDIFARLETVFQQIQSSVQVTLKFSDFIALRLQRDAKALLQNLPMLEQLAAPCSFDHPDLQQLWERNQIELLERLGTNAIEPELVTQLLSSNNELIQMILIAALSTPEKDTLVRIKMVKAQLQQLKLSELTDLAHYYLTDPKPNMEQLNSLLTHKDKSVAGMIDHFEQVIQAKGKRTYSLEEKDAKNIQRVLSGLKLKKLHNVSQGEQAELLHLLYYINTYSQALDLENKSNDDLLDVIQANKAIHTHEAKARVLACMREMVLRKTGKWVNHTQMIALLYAAMHNDENLLHQIRTGEGKSIITLMRVAYRALNGQIIDVFSSKESLSSRDHQSFSPVFDAFGIRHSHLTANSSPDLYHNTVNEQGVGAVHYSTIGNWSLFLSGQAWDSKDSNFSIDTHADNRVAYLDEGDHIMRFENTAFNFSDQADASSAFNYDAWAYKIAYEFYLENAEILKSQEFQVYEKPDLQSLYLRLQEASLAIAPDKSAFFQKYLASGDISLRNQHLVKLLTAAHLAKDLQAGVQYVVMSEQKKISDSITLDTRFAKVMINNQVYHGSTYSDLVQQFLHVRLNQEAILKGERPNFFVEPESEIALSLNARHVLKNCYAQIEACTGTPGNEEALAFYRDEFGIHRVVKLPTHEEVKTIFLPPVYAIDEEAQIADIVTAIRENPLQPILITCEDDRAVERLGKRIQQALGATRNLMIDTNAKGLTESEVLKDAGSEGAITISARLGRGSDIQPYDRELGLKVLRTYPDVPEVEKQDKGRQGRNAAGGVCQDIINYGAVLQDLSKYQSDERYAAMLDSERQHLEEKLAKHTNQDKEIWRVIRQDPERKEKYLVTRTLQRLKHKIQEESKQRIRDKDALIAEGSGQVIEYLFRLPREEKARLKNAWKLCKKTLETIWADDPEGERSRVILDEFYRKNKMQAPIVVRRPEPEIIEYEDRVSVSALLAFYQTWLRGMGQLRVSTNPALAKALYGEHGTHLQTLYQAFQDLNEDQLINLTNLVAHHPRCHSISCDAWAAAIELVTSDSDIAETYIERLNQFFRLNPNSPQTIEEQRSFNKSFLAAVAGAPDVQFIKNIIIELMPSESQAGLLAQVEQWPRQIVDLCKNGMTQEDIVFFLRQLTLATTDDTRCVDYLLAHYKALKEEPYMIRPLIAALSQTGMENLPFDDLNYSRQTAALLNFLSQRPGFTIQDFKDIQAKIGRVAEIHQFEFMTYLAAIPPYVSVRSVLTDLVDLPGKYSFEDGSSDFKQRIRRMQSAATALIDFLFDHDFITSKDSFTAPNNEEEFKFWMSTFPSFALEKREQFFVIMNKPNLDSDSVKRLAESYYGKLNTEQFQKEAQRLLTKKIDDPTVSAVGSRTHTPRLFGF